MDGTHPVNTDYTNISTPVFIVDESAMKKNLAVLEHVQNETGVKILLALKGFAMWRIFPLLRETLHGICASSPHEAMLGRYEFGREVHSFAAAYSDDDILCLAELSNHIVFNSFNQWRRYRSVLEKKGDIKAGLRVNPEHSEVKVRLYDPCAPSSRLGILRKDFDGESLEGISGLHFHTLCELNSDSLERTLAAFENIFSVFLKDMDWVNFGGGHHITQTDYDVPRLIRILKEFRERYPHLTVYMEPGEAVALNAGILAATVLDIVHNEMDIAILDTSASAHMPDVIEMPYRPNAVSVKEKEKYLAGMPGEYPFTYRFGGMSCLAGDVIGDYSFKEKLTVGDKVIFLDMAHYSMVKTNTFNGLKLPSIALYHPETDQVEIVREFGYENYKNRLS